MEVRKALIHPPAPTPTDWLAPSPSFLLYLASIGRADFFALSCISAYLPLPLCVLAAAALL